MKNLIKNFFLLLLLVFIVFSFRNELSSVWTQMKGKYFPCSSPIAYSLGSFDERFGISQTDFLVSLKSAEEVWEKTIGKNLFEYKEDGALKINLIYDTRQEVTNKLQKIDQVVDSGKGSYNEVKTRYETMKVEYQKQKKAFEIRLAEFDKRRDAYEADVVYWNSKGGATKDAYNKLQIEQKWLKIEGVEIANLQSVLNKKIDELNATATKLNNLASSLNINVAKFNEVNSENAGEFEEGTYERDVNGARINIYQFEDKGKLMRVLAHEFGHALDLEHIDDPKAIMYRLNNGINQELTENDITALKTRCELN